jgi:ATP-binding cassette subfamily B protein
MMVVLIPYGAWLPVALLLSTLPALFVVVRVDRTYHRWWQRTTTRRRRAQYYDMLLTQAPTAPEVRMFGLGRHFIYLYQQLRERLRKERLHLIQRQTVARVGAGAIGVLISGLTLGWMVLRAALGVASLGDLVLLYQAFQRGQGLMRSLLGSVGQIYTNTLFLGSLFTFLDLQPRLGQASDPASPPARLEHGIRFRNVTFTYPDAVRPALCQFDLTIPANQIVAIVGANGAGKTTLIKLLCRFYDPEQGRIELDGIDIREFAIDELRRRITVLFQIPITYLASFHDSVALGDITAQPTRSDTEAAARGAGAHDLAERLPRGYDTLLGKWFGEGVELSGGEWQRVAMARAYIRRRAPIILLDEPTSFMDSWAEADWFKRFRTLADGRTGLIITHRFTIAMRADIIHVVAQGQIVESGTHHELVTRGGLYAESWTTQMRSAAATVVPDHEVPAGSAA